MARKKRAMLPKVASDKKTGGHDNERHFADLIGGKVVGGKNTGKTDVIDSEDHTYSVKGGKKWQIFLYARKRFVTNTEFQEIGNIANLIIDCIDAFPESRSDYLADKISAKKRLQLPMRRFKDEICKPDIFPQLLSKAIFNGNEVSYFSALPRELSDKNLPLSQKYFHVFSAEDVVNLLSTNLEIENTKARGSREMDDQKVGFRYDNRRVGEIEIRTDSGDKYRRAFWRLDSTSMLKLLRSNLDATIIKDRQFSVYGSARNDF